MRLSLEKIQLGFLAVLITTVLGLHIYLLLHYRIHHLQAETDRSEVFSPAEHADLPPDQNEPRQERPADTLTALQPPLMPQPTQRRTKTDTIPKIIHLMWEERLVPFKQLQYVRQWRTHHSDWKIYFWSKVNFEKLLRSKYSHLVNHYNSLKPHDKIVSRRYFVMHQYGGVWADMDVEPRKPLDPLIENKSCILSQEPEIHAKLGWRIELMTGTAIFACRARHPFFELVLNLLNVNGKDPHTLAATGSVMLSRMYFRYREFMTSMDHPEIGAIELAEPETFMPLVSASYLNALSRDCSKSDDVASIRRPFCDKFKPLGYKDTEVTNKSYTVHHWFRSWATGEKIDKSTTSKRDIFEWMNIDEPPV